jgi:hypothetical protein
VGDGLVGVVTAVRLELEEVLEESDRCELAVVKIRDVPSRGALGTIACRGCLGCLLSGCLSWISG